MLSAISSWAGNIRIRQILVEHTQIQAGRHTTSITSHKPHSHGHLCGHEQHNAESTNNNCSQRPRLSHCIEPTVLRPRGRESALTTAYCPRQAARHFSAQHTRTWSKARRQTRVVTKRPKAQKLHNGPDCHIASNRLFFVHGGGKAL
jgi:hypothetical protein